MPDPAVHPELVRAHAWAAQHRVLLLAAWERFESNGEWPLLEELQRGFEREDIDIDVHALAWQMPKALGFVEQERLVLRVRGASFVAQAAALLADWAMALQLAYRRYHDDEQPVLRAVDLREELGFDRHRVDRVSRLLLRESWAFGSGHGNPEDDWDREVRSGVRVARTCVSAAEMMAARDIVEFPRLAVAVAPIVDHEEVGDAERRRRVMVVFGRDSAVNEALFAWLRTVDLRPQEWTELVAATGSASPYTGEVLDAAMEVVQAVVVLFTPDDLVRLRDELLLPHDGPEERDVRGQPRPNVLFEAGLAFGRHRDRTVLVEHGELRGLSDLTGRHAVRLTRGIGALRDLALRLENAGCAVDTSGEAWLDASRFPNAVNLSAHDVSDTVTDPASGGAMSAAAEVRGPDPLERLVGEILNATLPVPPAEDVVTHVAQRLRALEGPTRGSELFDGLPGRQLPAVALKRAMYELEQHGVLQRNPDRGVRGYIVGELPD